MLAMLSRPKLGQRVQVHYAREYARWMPLHGRVGVVAVVGTGRPRNHGVEIDGEVYVLPAGNLRPAPEAACLLWSES
jgi:hypothetical protein